MADEPILAREQELQDAMFSNDVGALDRLIDDELMFTTLTGEVVGKADDLEAHRLRRLRLTKIEPVERRVARYGNTVVVSALMALAGAYDGDSFDATFRYTRVWMERADGWRIVAGHMSSVAS
jgi:ketosteroid isomerase-like protein